MAGEYWKVIEFHRREFEIHEENERRKVLEEKLRIEEEARWREKEAKQRKEAEEKERQKILSQARSILLPMFQEIQANAPEVRQATKSRIIEVSSHSIEHVDYHTITKEYVEGIRLQYGEKLELTQEEKDIIDRHYWFNNKRDILRKIKRMLIFSEKRELPLPEEIISFNFSQIGLDYNEKNLFNLERFYAQVISNTAEFIQNPTIIIPNILDQLKLPQKQIKILERGRDYLKPPSRPRSPSPSSQDSWNHHCCCS